MSDAKSKGTFADPDLVAIVTAILEQGPTISGWNEKISKYTTIYRGQIKNSLTQKTYSRPEEAGIPWANIPSFEQYERNSNYQYRTTFDGIFEQPHDNLHGWLGGEKGDMVIESISVLGDKSKLTTSL